MKRLCLKRLRLVGVMVTCGGMGLSGCVLAPPPELEEPPLHAPDFIEGSAVPLPRSPLYTTEQTTGSFSVSLIADERGGQLKGALYINYDVSGRERYLGISTATLLSEASTPDATPNPQTPAVFFDTVGGEPHPVTHAITVPWQENRTLDPGCYQVTLAVTYASNFDENGVRPISGALTSTMTWWVAHELQPHEVSLENCRPPEPAEGTEEGGAREP